MCISCIARGADNSMEQKIETIMKDLYNLIHSEEAADYSDEIIVPLKAV